MPFVLPFSECSRQHLPRVGGKCASLGEMLQAGIPVPPGFAVSTRAFGFFLSETGLVNRIQRLVDECHEDDVESLSTVSATIQELVKTTPVPAAVERAVRDAYRDLTADIGHADLPVAVRSSATGEDSPDFSFAGLHESYLWVRGDDVMANTINCWASLYTPRALSYRLRMGIGHDDMLLSVGVQQMVAPRAAGVMFTLDPTNGDPSQVVIEGSWGLGESVVRGEVTPDRYRVDKVTLDLVDQVISPKVMAYEPDLEAGGIVECEVPAERQTQPCLTPEEAVTLATVAKRIERYYGRPQDIEWAIDHRLPFPDGLFIVQSRPETVWSKKPRRVLQDATTNPLGHVVNFLLKH